MTYIRPPAVAGMFYPDNPEILRRDVLSYLHAAHSQGPTPKALIAPHAGYIYSGPVAASAYHLAEPLRNTIERVVLLGPSHRVPFHGLAVSNADAFRTPLGDVPLDRASIDALLALPQVSALDAAHAQEHSLEVHLPFLQVILGRFTLLPLVVGQATAGEVDEVLARVWGGDETLIVISSDLSHYHDYTTARRMDRNTSDHIEALQGEALDYEDACGRDPVRGLLHLAARRGLKATTVDLRNSGDTAGPRDRVVGYGAYVLS
ncbi:MAG: AmmeMemoRadiSam system protein B [Chromatiales bacterium]|nr:AmmeMemoRadiSam system protein B [Chromatiales bacterium]